MLAGAKGPCDRRSHPASEKPPSVSYDMCVPVVLAQTAPVVTGAIFVSLQSDSGHVPVTGLGAGCAAARQGLLGHRAGDGALELGATRDALPGS